MLYKNKCMYIYIEKKENDEIYGWVNTSIVTKIIVN